MASESLPGDHAGGHFFLMKTAAIERCVSRAREEYTKGPDSFAGDVPRQDAAAMNIIRACEAALSIGHYLIRRERLGVPQSARDVFDLLARGGWISAELAPSMKNMVGFRNIAVHEYQKLQLPIMVAIITRHLDDFVAFSSAVLRRDGGSSQGTEA